MSEPEFDALPPGTLFDGNYEVVRTIGIGDDVGYLCRHLISERMVILKCVMTNSPVDLQRLRFESKCMSSISHPNVLPVLNVGMDAQGFPYMVMEYIDGETLAAILQRDGTLSFARFRNLFGQACDALSAVHSQQIVHRDIKPANFLISRTDTGADHLSLLGFTVPKKISSPSERISLAGEVVGTPSYISPEVCKGMDLDHRADIYSLGCCMYEAISGSPPFVGTTWLDTLSRHVSELPRLPIESKPEFASVEYVLARCLEKKPEDRFQSAAELKLALVGSPVETNLERGTPVPPRDRMGG